MSLAKTVAHGPIMIQVSVIVPFYNSERYIQRCVEGLLQQSFPREAYELILIDNNSTDSSAEKARQYPGIRLLTEPKQGAYAARNRGLQEAKGEILAFIDADCVPAHDWLQNIMMAMEQPNLSIVLGQREYGGDSLVLSMFAAYEDEKHHYVFHSRKKELYYGHTNNMAVKKHLFDELGPFVERARGSDTVFVRQSVNKYSCEVVRYCPQIRVRHLEIETPKNLYQKFFIYGRSRRSHRLIVEQEPLSNKERLQVFRNVVRTRQYSWMESMMFILYLGIGLAYWNLGAISLAREEKDPVE
ncbi:MAG TPA: glycosyltransferase [Nitrospirales bacterium]|nr:glycosyltransferase [Nitrospirales bacterium]